MNLAKNLSEDIHALLYRHPEELIDDIYFISIPTYLILFLSWIISCFIFDVLLRTKEKELQPNKITKEIRR